MFTGELLLLVLGRVTHADILSWLQSPVKTSSKHFESPIFQRNSVTPGSGVHPDLDISPFHSCRNLVWKGSYSYIHWASFQDFWTQQKPRDLRCFDVSYENQGAKNGRRMCFFVSIDFVLWCSFPNHNPWFLWKLYPPPWKRTWHWKKPPFLSFLNKEIHRPIYYGCSFF